MKKEKLVDGQQILILLKFNTPNPSEFDLGT